jgi:hypothetical protein
MSGNIIGLYGNTNSTVATPSATANTRVPDGLRVVIQMSAAASATAIKALTLEWVNPAFNPSRS